MSGSPLSIHRLDYATLALRDRFQAARRFRIVATEKSMADVEPLFQKGLADLAISFEPQFAAQLSRVSPHVF